MINKYCVVIGGMVFRVSLFQQSIGELLVAYNPATKLYLLHFEIYKGGLQRTRIVALSKHDTQYGNRKGAPPPFTPHQWNTISYSCTISTKEQIKQLTYISTTE